MGRKKTLPTIMATIKVQKNLNMIPWKKGTGVNVSKQTQE